MQLLLIEGVDGLEEAEGNTSASVITTNQATLKDFAANIETYIAYDTAKLTA